MLKDAATHLFSGNTTRLLTIHFHLTQPRAPDLDVHMNRQGIGCYAGWLAFSTRLSKSVGSEVSLGDDGKFTGNPDAAAKLNAKKDLLKECAAFAVAKGGITGFELEIPRYLKAAPSEMGTELVGVTLPRSKSMGFSASFGSQEFFEIAKLIDATL